MMDSKLTKKQELEEQLIELEKREDIRDITSIR